MPIIMSMNVATADRTSVLILRLWVEANHETGLRARITQSLDTGGTEHSIAVVTSAEDICAVVKQWVDAFVEPGKGNERGLTPEPLPQVTAP